MNICRAFFMCTESALYLSVGLVSGTGSVAMGVGGVSALVMSIPLFISARSSPSWLDIIGKSTKANSAEKLPYLAGTGAVCVLSSYVCYRISKAAIAALFNLRKKPVE